MVAKLSDNQIDVTVSIHVSTPHIGDSGNLIGNDVRQKFCLPSFSRMTIRADLVIRGEADHPPPAIKSPSRSKSIA
jgi:hypothetical protein